MSFKEGKIDLITLGKSGKADAIVITTNLIVKNNGESVMGAGIARQAAVAWPTLPALYGRHVKLLGESLYHYRFNKLQATVICLPTKFHWKDDSDLNLIDRSLRRLVELTKEQGWKNVCLTRPGCGLGGLNWERQVHPLATFHLDERFTVCYA